MRLVVLESPFTGDGLQTTEMNVFYLQHCLRDSLLRGESPYASHAIYTQLNVLDDKDPAERKLGMEAGFAWRQHADATVVYTDLGITRGVRAGIMRAEALQLESLAPSWPRAAHSIEYRTLPEAFWERPLPVLAVGDAADRDFLMRRALEVELRQFRKLYAIARSALPEAPADFDPYGDPKNDAAHDGPLRPQIFTSRGVRFAAGKTPDEPPAFHSSRPRFWVRCVTCCEEANADLPFIHHATTSVQAQVQSHGRDKHGWAW